MIILKKRKLCIFVSVLCVCRTWVGLTQYCVPCVIFKAFHKICVRIKWYDDDDDDDEEEEEEEEEGGGGGGYYYIVFLNRYSTFLFINAIYFIFWWCTWL